MRHRKIETQRVELTGTEWETLMDALDASTVDPDADAEEKLYRCELLQKLAVDHTFNGTVVIEG